ncbi:MAG: Hsp20/alpha crystallin family protein [Phenylobacterium sp.]
MDVQTQVPVKQSGAPSRSFFTPFGSLQREIDRLFDEFSTPFTGGREAAEIRCKMDLAETQDGLELSVEVPGLEEKDVSVAVSDGLLTVSGEKKFETEQKDKKFHFVERGYGSFARSISLPPNVKADDIKASLSKGVLKVTIPTPAKPEPKRIEVKTAD